MIVIHNFKEAIHLHQQGLIPLRLLQDQAMVLLGASPRPGRHLNEVFEIDAEDLAWLLQRPDASEDYDGMLGGDVHVCQSEADLKEIVGMDMEFAETHGGRWPNVTELVMGWDACDYLKEKSGDPEWAMFLLCWNDAGGPVYYVPKHLWKTARVSEHIAETNQFWNAE